MSRILLAGPNNFRWRSYTERLQGDGHEVVHVVNGMACVRRVWDWSPHILVLDPNILWGGGEGVLEIMEDESRTQATRIVLLTAGCDAPLLYRLSQFSLDDWLWQPTSALQLAQRLQPLLNRQRSGMNTLVSAPSA